VAWSTFPTLTDGQILTGAHTQIIRDNFAETAPGKATAAGQLWVSTGANAGAMRTPSFGHTSGSSTTTSGSFTDLVAGAGPAVTVTTGVSVITSHGAAASSDVNGGGTNMSYAISGATTVAADLSRNYRTDNQAADVGRATTTHFTPGLTAGSNTFTAKYSIGSGGTATFSERHLLVFPL
jgi:hypothetical protein